MKEEMLCQLLKEHPLFAAATAPEVQSIGRLARVSYFRPSDHVALHGDTSSPLYLILDGELRAFVTSEDGHEIPVRTYGAGHTFGAATLIHRTALPWNVAAIRHSMVATLSRANAAPLLRSPTIAPSVIELMAAELFQMMQRYNAWGLSRASARISALIVSGIREASTDVWPVVEIPDQATVAALTKVSRETVSRVLKSLESRGVIVRAGRRLRIRDVAALQKLAAGHAPA